MANYSGDHDKRKPSLDTVLKKLDQNYNADWSENIAPRLEDDRLEKIANEVRNDYDLDKQSRGDWEKSADRAMDVALQVRQPKNYPFENASNIKYPLVTVAALQFGARAYPAIVDGQRIVKGIPLGEDQTGEKRSKAERIAQHMSYQLLYEMEEWEEDTDVLLHHLPIVGCAFRKVWRDGTLNRNKARMTPATRLVVNNSVSSLDEAQRVTDEVPIYPQEIEERKRAGIFSDHDYPNSDGVDKDAPHEFLEQHRFLDLDGDGYREPYIVTLHKESNKVARIVANYRPDQIVHDGRRILRIPKQQYFVKYSFLRDPKGGFYDIGFGKLLESLSEVIDTTINQMMDAGHLQNAGGGFIGSGLRLKKGQITLSPGMYKYVEASGATLKDAIYNFEHPGPSPVLFSLLELLLAATKDITGVKDILTGDTGTRGAMQPTTILAMIEQGLKVFTSIYKRVWTSMRQEMKLLFLLNAEYLGDQEYFTFLDSQQAIAKQDYDPKSIDVMPVADPRMVTDMQRAARAQFLMGMLQHPFIAQEEALHRIFDAMGEPNVDTLIVPPQADPIQQAAAEVELEKGASEADRNRAAAEKDRASIGRDDIKTIADMEKAGMETEIAAITAISNAANQEEQTKQKKAANG